MKQIIIVIVIYIFFTTNVVFAQRAKKYTPLQVIKNHGFSGEEHYVTTEDGYILTIQRIPSRINETTTTKKPSLLMSHGLISSSVDFMHLGNRSMAFVLANGGYDIWLVDHRGNEHSRNHTTLNATTDKKKFFNFSWHEIGYYDLAASIDYILRYKNESSLYFLGYSQGVTSYLVLTSTRPEYNKKIRLAHLVGPSVLIKHCRTVLIRPFAPHWKLITRIAKRLKIYEVPFMDSLRRIGPEVCIDPKWKFLCDLLFTSLEAATISHVDPDLVARATVYFPSNASFKQLLHFLQIADSGNFAQYDHGEKKNLKVYGTREPPHYDLDKASAPIAIYYGQNDYMVDLEEAKTLISNLPNVGLAYLVPRPTFNHFDFALANDSIVVYQKILDISKFY